MTTPVSERNQEYLSLIRYPDFAGRMSGFLKELFIAKGWIEPAPGNQQDLYVTPQGRKHAHELGLDHEI